MRGGAIAAGDGVTVRAGALAVAAVVFAYGLTLRRYGLELVDEGTLLAQFAAVAGGAVPYRDFQTGYGPLAFYWNAGVLRIFGGDLVAIRTVLALVHATSAGLLYAIGRLVGGRGVAVAAVVLLWGMLRPVAPGAFAVFNVPYPAWLAEAIGLGAVLTLIGARRRPGLLVGVGALWGLAFLTKQNAGLFGLAGTAVYVGLTAPASGGAERAWPGVALACAMVLGLVALTGGALTPVEWVALGTPVLLLAVAVVRARPGTAAVREGVVLASGFLGVVGPVLVLLAAGVGAGTVVAEVFQVGTGAAARFRLPYPGPVATIVEGWRDAPGMLVAGRRVVDGLWLVLLPAVAIVAAAGLALRPRQAAHGRVAVVSIGALCLLQLYPRADPWHALPVAGPLVVVGLVLVREAAPTWWRPVMALAVSLAALRSAPTGPVLASVLRAAPADAPIVPHASIRWDLVTPDHLRRVPEVARTLVGVRSLLGFPALGFFNFVTGAPSPVRQGYFFPGQPGPAETRAVLQALSASPPDAVVVLEAPIAFFDASFAAHPDIVAWLRSPAWATTRLPPYTVGRRLPP